LSLAALRAAPGTSAIFVDFDGTLAPIVEDPATAAPLPGAVEVLRGLAERYGLVAVVSGRPIDFLYEHLGEGIVLVGLYGLERYEDGGIVEDREASPYRAVLSEVADEARIRFGGDVEDKGLSLTVHFRRHPEREEDVMDWAGNAGVRTGLFVRPAKASVELHPPIRRDKGTVVDELLGEHRAVVFLGDDVGDLPAFDALDRAAARGLTAVRVAVGTSETPAALTDRADLVVDGPTGALALFRSLLV
jgi:trehalose 6-phosphate phosphatase